MFGFFQKLPDEISQLLRATSVPCSSETKHSFAELVVVNMASTHLVDPQVPNTGLNIGIMTSGGDAQGMNAAIRSVVRRACVLGASVWAIYEGYMGMVQGGDMIRHLKWDDVSGLLPKVRFEGRKCRNTCAAVCLALLC